MSGLLDWYLLGVALGLGVAAGLPGLRRDAPGRIAFAVVPLAAVAAGLIAALAVPWAAIAALLGVGVGVFSFRHLARGAVPAAALALAALAFVPAVGYLEALVAPVLGERLRRRAASRYAGLRVLAKD